MTLFKFGYDNQNEVFYGYNESSAKDARKRGKLLFGP